MKIVILDGFTANPGDLSWSELQKLGDVTVYERTAPEETVTRAADAEVVLTNKVLITREVMAQLPKLKYIGVLATGYNVVDVKEAHERGIVVTNVPAYSTESVAQMVFSHLLTVTNRTEHYAQQNREGKWSRSKDFCYWDAPITELAGKTFGIVGLGNIGMRVAQIALAFGMKVNVYSQDKEAAMKSDIVTLHCPASPENKGFVNKEFFRDMKDGAILINTARGALVNEKDLREALDSGKLAAAAVDVVNGEPQSEDSPLIGAKNLYITPHLAWSDKEARMQIINTAADNLRSFLEGGDLNRIV